MLDAAGLDLVIDDVSFSEGDSGARMVDVPVRLTSPASGQVTVDFEITGGTAVANDDYLAPRVFTGFSAPAIVDNAGFKPWEVTVGDVDEDGDADLMTVDPNNLVLKIFQNTGDGSFTGPRMLQLGGNLSSSPELIDLNGDGHLDAFASARSSLGRFHVFPGNGDGTFGGRIQTGTMLFLDLAPLAMADLNNDNRPDVVTVSTTSGDDRVVMAFLNDGTGRFNQSYQSSNVGDFLGAPAPNRDPLMDAGDINGDGRADVVLATQEGKLWTFRGNGDGTFSQSSIPNSINGDPLDSVNLADLNNDGALDVVMVNSESDQVAVRLNDRAGNMGSITAFGAGDFPVDLDVADIDSDGQLDLVTANQGPRFSGPSATGDSVSLLRGIGDGTFLAAEHFWAGDPLAGGTFPSDVVIADFNNDSVPDLVIGHGGGSSTQATILSGQTDRLSSARLVFAPGQTVQNIPLEIVGDTASESDETVVIRLSNPVGATIADIEGQLTIEDDDTMLGSISGVAFHDENGDGVRTGTMVYSQDFEQNSDLSMWSHPRIDTTPSGRRFLGQFGNDPATLNLNGLPKHSAVEVDFDLYVIRSWDGNDSQFGPDQFVAGIVDVGVLLHTSFSNAPWHNQSYPDAFPNGDSPYRTGAVERDSLGYGQDLWGDAVYHISLTASHDADDVVLGFAGINLQDLADESFGLGNVQVRVVEEGLEGQTIYLDENNNSIHDNGERSTVTDRDGKYVLSNLAAGSYTVRQQLSDGWTQTTPANSAARQVTLNAGEVASKEDFGSQQQAMIDLAVKFTERDQDGKVINELTQLPVGQEFFIDVYAQDLRTSADATGVLSAFTDVIYNTDLIDVTRIDHTFDDFATGTINDATGTVDEVGGLENSTAGDRDPQLVFSLKATANQLGTLTIETNAGESRLSENQLFGIDGDLRNQTFYDSHSIDIVGAELVASSFDASPDHALLGETTVNFTIENTGFGPAGAFSVDVVHSSDDVIGNADDVVVTTVAIDGLANGQSATRSINLQLDVATLFNRAVADDAAGLGVGYVSTSSDYLGLVVDPANRVNELDERNNFAQGKGIDADDISFFPWDTNGNGVVTPTDVGFIINRIGQFSPPADARADLDGNGAITPSDAGSAVNRIGYARNDSVIETAVATHGALTMAPVSAALTSQINANLMAITTTFSDNTGTPISVLQTGQPFRINVLAQDLRATGTQQGVLSAFADVLYDTSLADIDGLVHTFDDFSTGTIDEFNGEVDEAGGLEYGGPTSRQPQLLFYLEATAGAAGTFTVDTRAGQSIFSQNLLVGIDNDLRSQTTYDGNRIQIVAAPATSTDQIGVFRGRNFYLDVDGDDVWNTATGTDQRLGFGNVGDTPLVGDWNGDGLDEIGVRRSSGGVYRDLNGNGTWDGAGSDGLTYFGRASDAPVSGDWNQDGRDDIGVFRDGKWYLDLNGNGSWDGTSRGDAIGLFGAAGDQPVVGDWSGDGSDDFGVFRNGRFYLDQNGNGLWDGQSGGDTIHSFGASTDFPISGKWGGDGNDHIGVYRSGRFYLDASGNGSWDGPEGGDQMFVFGATTDIPIIGNWRQGSATEDVVAVTDQSRETWQAGLTTRQLNLLHQNNIPAADSPTLGLGQATGSIVGVDVDAAAQLADQTNHLEGFERISQSLAAAGESAAVGQVELLTAVLDELGLVLN